MTAPSPIELSGGHWEKRGLTQVWVEDEPDWDYIIKSPKLDPQPQPEDRWHVTGVLCECGCLLRDEAELCPACVRPWMYAAEQRGIRTAWERANRRGGDERLQRAMERGAA